MGREFLRLLLTGASRLLVLLGFLLIRLAFVPRLVLTLLVSLSSRSLLLLLFCCMLFSASFFLTLVDLAGRLLVPSHRRDCCVGVQSNGVE